MRNSATNGTGPDLVDALVQTSFVTMALLSKIGSEQDLSLTQLRVLAILRDRRLRMSELADYLGLDKSSMSGLIDRAERRGLVERTANATDGRAIDVVLTNEGMELAERLTVTVAQSLAPMTSCLTTPERSRLNFLLTAMLDEREPPTSSSR